MEIKEFIINFAEAVDVDESELSPELEFKELPKWDSMAVLSVIAMVDEYYSKVLTGEDIDSAKTLTDLFNILVK